jgi:hypothetical protein
MQHAPWLLVMAALAVHALYAADSEFDAWQQADRDALRQHVAGEQHGVARESPSPSPSPSRAMPSRTPSIGFDDDLPDGPQEKNRDSDNFFLREAGDHEQLAVWFHISAMGRRVRSARLDILPPDGDAPLLSLQDILAAGEVDDAGSYCVRWRAPIATRPQPFYRVQLRVAFEGMAEEMVTPVHDADPDAAGWQCPQQGLAVHDLAWKHRPIVHVHPDDIGRPCSVAEFVIASGGRIKEWKGVSLEPVVHQAGKVPK